MRRGIRSHRTVRPREFFRYCPRCGARQETVAPGIEFLCAACEFQLFFNPTVSAGGFLRRSDGRILWLKRAKDPARGKLGLPGGFIDFDESAEAALAREVKEEVGLVIGEPRFLCSVPNEYVYRDVTYPVLDLIFAVEVGENPCVAALDEVECLLWLAPAATNPDDIAFPSVRQAFVLYRRQLTGAP